MTDVRIVSNRNDSRIEEGALLPPLFSIEKTSSVNILIDGKDSISPQTDNPWDFTVDLTANVYRGRSLQCIKAIVPKLNNVTPFNNQIQIKHALGTTAIFSVQPAFYNTTTLSNELTSKINSALAAVPVADTVTTAFDPITKTFSITSVGGNNFFIVNTSSFITRGRFLAPFESEPLANTPSKSVIYSSQAGMIYSRYITVHSQELSQYSFADSVTSSFDQQSNIVALIDVSDIYEPEDFSVGVAFAGSYKSLTIKDGPQISILNSQRNIHNVFRVFALDEYGTPVQNVMNLGAPYPENTLGLTIWFSIRF